MSLQSQSSLLPIQTPLCRDRPLWRFVGCCGDPAAAEGSERDGARSLQNDISARRLENRDAATQSLLFFADDWGRHPSSSQHLVSRLLPRYPVTWVNTIGMRTPRLNLSTFQRGVEKLVHWTRISRSSESHPENLTVLNPKMWPWFTRSCDRTFNRYLLTQQLLPVVRRQAKPITAVTTLPIVSDLLETLPVARWVYYCVDDFSEWPGLDRQSLFDMESALIDKADVLIAASEALQERLADRGRHAELLTHGVDLEQWQSKGHRQPREFLQEFEEPRVVFWGLIDRRLDVEFLRALNAIMDRGSILLVGPQDNSPGELKSLDRLRMLPAVPFAELPCIADVADVLIMPYADLPVTRAMQPLKLLEYLATGKPVVVRDLPATRHWSDCLDVANTAARFAELVRERLQRGASPEQLVARQRLVSESWDVKANKFERLALT